MSEKKKSGRAKGRSAGEPTTLRIKNMVCDRCIRVVREELTAAGLEVRHVELGHAVVVPYAGPADLAMIGAILQRNGFELLDDKRAQTVDTIKTAIIRLVRQDREGQEKMTPFPVTIARELGKDYHALSSLFSSVEHMTIERYTILQRIERAKELLVYGELTLSEIAFRMGYSSVQHLSNQFRQITGLSPTAFKQFKHPHRSPLDKVGEKRH